MPPNEVCEYPSKVKTKLKPLPSQAGELVGLLHAHLKSACLCTWQSSAPMTPSHRWFFLLFPCLVTLFRRCLDLVCCVGGDSASLLLKAAIGIRFSMVRGR